MSILEAMAAGKPVVAPRVGGIPEIITHEQEGLLVEGRTPAQFTRSCWRLLEDKNLRMVMGEKALRKVVTSFSDRAMADAYLRLYASLYESWTGC